MRRIPKKDTPELLRQAQQMRRQPTQAEVLLLDHIGNRQLQGIKFRFQHILLGYILDFYSPEYRIAVELDGAGHDAQDDAIRDRAFAVWGVLTMRFPNEKPAEEIVAALKSAVQARQVNFIRAAAQAMADLKAIGRGPEWLANRRAELQRQKSEVMARQLNLDMPSSIKKTDQAALVVAHGLHLTEPHQRKA